MIDCLMFIALMLLMPYQMVGKEAHEWIGIIRFFLFICHHMMNQKWTRNINKGKYSFFTYMVNNISNFSISIYVRIDDQRNYSVKICF